MWFKQFGNPLLLRLKKTHTHTHIYIYIYSIYIHNCIDMTQKGKDMKAKNQKRHVFCEKNCSLSRSLVVHLQKVSPPPGIGTSVASPNTERSAKARSADCARCGGCPGRPSWTSKKKNGPIEQKRRETSSICLYDLISNNSWCSWPSHCKY